MTALVPFFWVAAGLLGLAGVFFLLQRLRVRQEPVTVETTLFWKDAIEDARARVLVQRFRHPWVYALLLLIGALLWLGFSGVERSSSELGRHVVLLDASAGMAEGARFQGTIDLVEEYVSDLSPQDRWVIVCADRPQTVLRPGEEIHLLRKRLMGISPQAIPSTVEAAIVSSLAGCRESERWTFCVAGAAELSQAFIDTLPKGITLTRLGGSKQRASNVGIVSLGAAAARSGEWDLVDVLIEVRGNDEDVLVPVVTIDGRTWNQAPAIVMGVDSKKFFYRDIQARGQLLRATIAAGGGLELDDHAQLVLADRSPLAVLVAPGVPLVLVRALEADPAVNLVESGARVVVRQAGSEVGGGLPALEIVSENEQADGIFVVHAEDEDPQATLRYLYDKLGLSEIDASDVSRAKGGLLTMGASPGQSKSLRLWDSLLSDEFNFTQSRAFPLFVAMGVRWLAGFKNWPDHVAVGMPVMLDDNVVSDGAGHVYNDLGDQFRPVRRGIYQTNSGVRFAAEFLDHSGSSAFDSGAELAVASSSSTGASVVTILLFLALGLIFFEWVLFRLGRIP